MKRLIFVRHGKAEESESYASDFVRSLTAKGKDVSAQMAKRLAKREKGELTIVTSPAFRAIETALIFAGITKTDYNSIIINESIYGSFGIDQLIHILEEAGEGIETVALFGHNPSFSMLVNHFSETNRGFMPKSGVACFEFKTSAWNGISAANATLIYFLSPDGTDE
jgi:phosphohistidine phosphatase